ncbi:MAG: hypothetical protein WDW36_005867 [Sanguina aurantia]
MGHASRSTSSALPSHPAPPVCMAADMDGTLTVPVINFKLMRSRVGVPDGKDILDFISTQSVEQQALSHAAIKEIEAQALEDMSAMPGVHDLCEMLDAKSIPRGLITRNVAHSVAHFHANHMALLQPFCPAISRECPHEYKPSPAALFHICKTWGIAPSEVMMVGDSLKDDIVSGNRAGCITVFLDYETSQTRTPMDFPEGELRPTYVDDSRSLSDHGLSATTKVLIMLGRPQGQSIDKQSMQALRMDKVKRVAERLAGRDFQQADNSYQVLTLENQAGVSIVLQPGDKQAITMALTLHDTGLRRLKLGKFDEALEALLMAEEAVATCDTAVVEGIDNVALLLLDIVWCCYKMGDLQRLAVSRERLARCRKLLLKAHGPGLERVRKLHGEFCPELATYVRLHAVEGVVAYHMQEPAAALLSLENAQRRWRSLQVSDEALASMQAMGYTHKDAGRALRLSANNVGAAVAFLEEQKVQSEVRKDRRKRERAWEKERKLYGKTASGMWVDEGVLEQLLSLGYQREVAAEALRRDENNVNTALDVLSNPSQLRQLALSVRMAAAMRQASNSGGGASSASTPLHDTAAALAASLAAAMSSNGPDPTGHTHPDPDGGAASAANGGAASTPDGVGAAGGQSPAPGGGPRQEKAAAAAAALAAAAAAAAKADRSVSDDEVEGMLVGSVREDPMAAYDVDVREEGELISTYLALLESAAGGSPSTGSTGLTSPGWR